jgi:ABC-2 type transport system ATP-binding protein
MIKTAGLRKAFRSGKTTVEAVRGVDLDVGDGEIFGFLGPNGAGKTTTLRMLATLIRPDGGSAASPASTCCSGRRGAPAHRLRGAGRRHLGRGVGPRGTGLQAGCTARHRRVPRAGRRAIEAFQLGEFADRQCKTYSGGQRRRVDIALGVIHRPRSSSSTSRPPAWTRRAAPTCGTRCAACATRA